MSAPDLGPDFIVIPVADLPVVAEDDTGHMSVNGLDSMTFVGGPISAQQPGRSHPFNMNQNPRNEYARAMTHLAFMRHLEADPDEATRVFTLAQEFATADGHARWFSLGEKKRAKYLKRARIADRATRSAVSR